MFAPDIFNRKNCDDNEVVCPNEPRKWPYHVFKEIT